MPDRPESSEYYVNVFNDIDQLNVSRLEMEQLDEIYPIEHV